MKIISMAALVVVLASSVLQSTYAATYTVGDATGWTIPINNTDFYDDWTDNKNFVVGDVLEFNFTTGQHDVAEVNETAYDNCITTNPIARYTTGPASITLNRTGEYHFICTVPRHCGIGQKLSIDVRTGPSTAPTPADYEVGDDYGWDVPPSNSSEYYPSWANRYEFKVGDSAVFNWTGNHTAAQVRNQADYDNCNTNATEITLYAVAGVRVPFTTEGFHYFICTVGTHCEQGQKKMAMKIVSMTATLVALASNVLQITYAATYTVGDTIGWVIPTGYTELYRNWTDDKNFLVGDILVFKFTTGEHDVAKVTEAAYNACSSVNTILTRSTGPARITLNIIGDHHFICTFADHCAEGQKLSVEVRNGPRTAPVPGTSHNTTGTPPSPPSSASSLVATISLVFMSIGIQMTGAVAISHNHTVCHR
ncbi:hypothetical protein J1N35_032756 [Gossypium stocksii]|uniref:Phytocyanin domain-containing protein n=1 Tax=Gossypium stocksii TaxID=47602 RepID=A0A9D3V537_9ROSI|nr:hypothetical protein J1N35_032756 [Gossypium stocksii]